MNLEILRDGIACKYGFKNFDFKNDAKYYNILHIF
ncbi:hypothetical protein BAPKO_0801 [Borreliella afzelii PKo]|nr:hypothetical protein BAPKO_0801 [Borreliella afzelii PKo]AFU75061.1 hypothetical protein BafHLJ01_0831 [Borreliella afzelii HLJ01]